MMITTEILKFLENVKPWQEALNNRKEINDRPAIYALISNLTLPSLSAKPEFYTLAKPSV